MDFDRFLDKYAQDFNAVAYMAYLESAGLMPMLEYVVVNNPSERLPYHNTDHMFIMAYTADHLYNNSLRTSHDMERKALAISCLWHDYAHSGGGLEDCENIQVAIACMKAYVHAHQPELTPLVNKVAATIYCTEFPFKHKPRSLIARCARDADLLYTRMDPNSIDRLKGLFEELQPKLDGMSWQEFMESNQENLAKFPFFCQTAQAIARMFDQRIVNKQKQTDQDEQYRRMHNPFNA